MLKLLCVFFCVLMLFACNTEPAKKNVPIIKNDTTVVTTPAGKDSAVKNKGREKDIHYGANASIILFGKNSDHNECTLSYEVHGNNHEELWFYKPGIGTEVQLIPQESATNQYILLDNMGDERGTLIINKKREEEGFEFPSEVTIVFKTKEKIVFRK